MRLYYNEISDEQKQLQKADVEFEKFKQTVLNNSINGNNNNGTGKSLASSISIEQQQKEDRESKKDK
eukprot:UN04275